MVDMLAHYRKELFYCEELIEELKKKADGDISRHDRIRNASYVAHEEKKRSELKAKISELTPKPKPKPKPKKKPRAKPKKKAKPKPRAKRKKK
jgi:hypothetical protein